MKPRVVVTQKILAVALTAAAAGCSTAAGNDVIPRPVTGVDTPAAPTQAMATPGPAPAAVAPEPVRPLADMDGYPLVGNMGQGKGGEPKRPRSDDPALLALRDKLLNKPRAKVLANPEPFQPLCDKDGYPLVGNLMRKVATPDYQPSAFCRDLHAQAMR
jgi:hypothetical protein